MQQISKIFKHGVTFAASISVIVAVSISPAAAQPLQPTYRYTRIAAPQSNSSLTTNGTTTNAAGDSFTIGNFAGTVNFAGSMGSDIATSLNGGGQTVNSGYLTKRHSDGSYVWTKTTAFGPGSGYVEPANVTVDGGGNTYVYGYFVGDVIFDGPGGSNHIDSGGLSSIYLTKYDAVGAYLWTHTATAASNQSMGPKGFAVDSAGNMYLAGTFQGPVDFGITWGTSDIQTAPGSNSNVYLTRVNANGSYAWTQTFDASNGSASSAGLAIDPQGGLYVTGYYSNSVTFDGIGGNGTLTDTTGNGGCISPSF